MELEGCEVTVAQTARTMKCTYSKAEVGSKVRWEITSHQNKCIPTWAGKSKVIFFSLTEAEWTDFTENNMALLNHSQLIRIFSDMFDLLIKKIERK